MLLLQSRDTWRAIHAWHRRRHRFRLVRIPLRPDRSFRGQLLDPVGTARVLVRTLCALLLQAEGASQLDRRLRLFRQLLSFARLARLGVLWARQWLFVSCGNAPPNPGNTRAHPVRGNRGCRRDRVHWSGPSGLLPSRGLDPTARRLAPAYRRLEAVRHCSGGRRSDLGGMPTPGCDHDRGSICEGP